MKREELLNSKEYWLAKMQIDLFNQIKSYMEINKLNRTQLAEKLGVSKGYITQILNGDSDHRISKIVELSLSVGLVPQIKFETIEYIIEKDEIDSKAHDIEQSIKTLTSNGYLVSYSNRYNNDIELEYSEQVSA